MATSGMASSPPILKAWSLETDAFEHISKNTLVKSLLYSSDTLPISNYSIACGSRHQQFLRKPAGISLIAVVGAGVAGTGTAWLLQRGATGSRFSTTGAGGHANTVDGDARRRHGTSGRFLVFNGRPPNLIGLFGELGWKPRDQRPSACADGGRLGGPVPASARCCAAGQPVLAALGSRHDSRSAAL